MPASSHETEFDVGGAASSLLSIPLRHSARVRETILADIEQGIKVDDHLMNTTVYSLVWHNITVTVKDGETKQPKEILQNVSGIVEPGQLCALMGPSGSGKTTLLNVLARRGAAANANVEGLTLVNESSPSNSAFQHISSYVEQEDALIGSLTVRETLDFAARLSRRNLLTTGERLKRVDVLLDSFGLANQANTIIGTPIRKGISGGQKRRVSVASQLITGPKILFLDEPTSGLDSAASFEVISYIKDIAKRNNLIVIASIHQPSTSTFNLFSNVLLLSSGRPQYFGPVDCILSHFTSIGFSPPLHTNIAEHLLEITNTDFASTDSDATDKLSQLHQAWLSSPLYSENAAWIQNYMRQDVNNPKSLTASTSTGKSFPIVLVTLVHRSFIKSYRDFTAYGVRIAMYIGLAFMMGTVWLRLGEDQVDIQPYVNALFFGSAFISFMAVAYVPSFLEDRSTFIKERANGLYGPSAFMLSNFLIGIPYLYLTTLIFSLPTYFLINFRLSATSFWLYTLLLYLDLLAAESLVVLITSLFPSAIISLALTAFANGLWMSVGGFLVPMTILNVFWKYVFHYIDYQAYVFQALLINEFSERTYTCGSACACIYTTDLASDCKIAGEGVLSAYGYRKGGLGKWVGILVGIVIVYRALGLAALWWRK